jgi:xanthine phosphoribosyltransferase
MDKLKQRVLRDAKVLPGNIIKVGGFLNHMVDINLMQDIGKEFAGIFRGKKPTKILTIEASGIPIAALTAVELDIPFIIAKKYNLIEAGNANEDDCSQVVSHTKKSEHAIRISKAFLNRDDRVLILDDFLANGDAALALLDIIDQANVTLAGIGICIEKSFQKGASDLLARGVNLHSLVRVKSLEGGVIDLY